MTWQLRDEVWGIFYDAQGLRWESRCVGRIVAVSGSVAQYRTPAGKLETVTATTFPAFRSEAEARRWADENPPAMPGISPRTSR